MISLLLIYTSSIILMFLGSRFIMREIFRSGNQAITMLTGRKLLLIALLLNLPVYSVLLTSMYLGKANIGAGTIMGCNLLNICVILSISAVLNPLNTSWRLNKWLIVILLIVTIVFTMILNDRLISSLEGMILLLLLISIILVVRFTKRYIGDSLPSALLNALSYSRINIFYRILYSLLGIFSLSAGTYLMTTHLHDLSEMLKIGETLTGFTLVAFGTSLPLMLTALRASSKEDSEMVIGIILISNILNIVFMVGVLSMAKPFTAFSISNIDLITSIGSILFLLQFLRWKYKMRRDEAYFLLFLYALYIYYLFPK